MIPTVWNKRAYYQVRNNDVSITRDGNQLSFSMDLAKLQMSRLLSTSHQSIPSQYEKAAFAVGVHKGDGFEERTVHIMKGMATWMGR
jgi:hypothetical protein